MRTQARVPTAAPPKWKAYMAARAQPRVKSFQGGGENDPYADADDTTSAADDRFVFPPPTQLQAPQTVPAAQDRFDFQQPGQAQTPQDRFVFDTPSDLPKLAKGIPGMAEAAGIKAARNVVPLGGAVIGGNIGATVGTAIGTAAAPFTFGAAVPIGTWGGALGGAYIGGLISNWFTDKALEESGYKPQVERYEAAAEKQFPKSAFAGELAPNVLGFGLGQVPKLVRAASGLIQGAGEAASEKFQGEGDINLGKVLAAAGVGTVLAKPRAWTEFGGALPGMRQLAEYSESAARTKARTAAPRGVAPEYTRPTTTGEPTEPTPQEAPEAARQPAEAEVEGEDAHDDATTPVQPDNPPGSSPTAVKPANAAPTPMAGVQSPDRYAKTFGARGNLPPPERPFGKRTAAPTVGDVPDDVAAALQAARPGRPAMWEQQHPVSETPSVEQPTSAPRPEITDAVRAKLDPEGYAQNRGQQIWRDAGLLGQQQAVDRPALFGGSTEPRPGVTSSVAGERPAAPTAEPAYWEKPPTAAEYPHGDQDMGHVTLNREQDVPGNVRSDPNDPSKVYVDKNLPPTVNVGGKPIDPAYPLAVRENARRAVSDKLAQARATYPGMANQAVRHDAMASNAGDIAERMWLESRGINHDQFKAAIGEPPAQRGFAPPEATGATPPPAAPSPAEASALADLAARQNAVRGRPGRAVPPGEAEALADLAARQTTPAGITEAPPRPGPPGAPPEPTPPPRPQPVPGQPPTPPTTPPGPPPAPTPPPRAAFGKRRPAPETTGTVDGPAPTPPAQAAAVAREGEQIAKTAAPEVSTVRKFLADEKGTVGAGQDMTLPQAIKMLTSQGGAFTDKAKKLWTYAKERYAPGTDWRNRRARSAQEQLGFDINDQTQRWNQRDVQDQIEAQQFIRGLKGGDKALAADANVQSQAYLAHEAQTTGKLSQRVEDWYNKLVKPIFDENAADFARAKVLAKGLPEDMQAEILAELDPGHLHRMAKGYNAPWDNLVSGQSRDPVEGMVRGVGTNPSSMQTRKFFAIEDETGKSTVVTPTKEGLTLWDKGNERFVPTDGKFEVGDKITIDGKEYTARQALTPEIEANARFSDGRMAEYHKNIMQSALEERLKIKSALRKLEYLADLKNDPKFQQYTANLNTPEGKAKARANGWIESQMPQMRGIAMDPMVRYAFDEYSRPGVQSPVTDWLRPYSQGVTKTLFFTPIPHALNAFWHWWVGRGWDWASPTEWGRLIPELMQAYRSVVTQDAMQKAIREAGGGTVSGGILTSNFTRSIADGIGLDAKANPAKWAKYAEQMGLGTGPQAVDNLVRGLYNWSSRSMWQFNDVLLTHQIMRNQRAGMSLENAISHAEQHIPNYRMPMTVMGSRQIAQVLGDPSLVAFGRYHSGVYNSLTRMVKGLTFGNPQERSEAAGNLFALGLFALVAKPLILDPMVKAITGDETAETKPRGPLAPLTTITKLAGGRSDLSAITSELATLSPMVGWGIDTIRNQNFKGKHIVTPGSPLLQQAGQVAEHMAGLLPPVRTIEAGWSAGRPGETGGESALRALASQAFDVKTQKPGAEAKAAKAIRQEAQQRAKKPEGPIESATQWLGRQFQ